MSAINLLDEDLQLWSNFRNGDADAFARLMRIHYQDLYNYGLRIAHSEDMVKDGIQDLFLYLWEHRQKINDTSFVKYYLLKSLRRSLIKCIDNRKHINIADNAYFEGIFDKTMFVENATLKKESTLAIAEKVRLVLSGLPHRQQEMIYLRFYLDADIDEIAEIMDLNRQSVYNLLHRALKKLKDITAQRAFSFSSFVNMLPSFIFVNFFLNC